MNWRATQILTGRRDLAIVPNSSIAKAKIVNVSSPSGVHGITVTVGIDGKTPPSQSVELLRRAVLNCRTIMATRVAHCHRLSLSGEHLFQTAQTEPAPDCALQHDKKQKDRDRRHDRDGHLLGRRIAVILAKLDQAERIGAQAIDRDYGERPEILVPT